MSEERTDLHSLVSKAPETAIAPHGYPRLPDGADTYGYPVDPVAEGEGINWQRWGKAVYRYKWMILCLSAFISALVVLQAYRYHDTYQATATIVVGKEDTTLVRSGELLLQNEETLRTKLIMLQSSGLIEDVIANLKLDQRKELLEPPKRSLPETFQTILHRLSLKDDYDLAADKAVEAKMTLPDVQAEPQPRSLAESRRLEHYVDLFRKDLRVEGVPETRLIKITFEYIDPFQAAAICNYMARTFIERNYEGKTEKFSQASTWLTRTGAELKERMEKAEKALGDYTSEHTGISLKGGMTAGGEKLVTLHGEAARAESEKILKESLYEEAKQGRVKEIPEAFTDAQMAELQKKQAELNVTLAQTEVNYGPENPQTLEIKQQIASIQKQMEANTSKLEAKLKAEYERAMRNDASFKAAVKSALAQTAQENTEAVRYNILQQEAETARALYREFQEKNNNARFELTQQQNNMYLTEQARASRKTSGPQRKLWILIGFVFSLMMGIGGAVLLDYLDPSVKDYEGFKRQLQLPLLAVIPGIGPRPNRSLLSAVLPHSRRLNGHETAVAINGANGAGGNSRIISINDWSPEGEAYRKLRTSIILNAEGPAPKTLLFTSGYPGDGKTTTTINTAISLAQLGKSVVIIDCDLRTPRLHERLRIKISPGLTDWLGSNGKGSYGTMKKVPGTVGEDGAVNVKSLLDEMHIDNLKAVPSGEIPPNPAELLSSEKMREFLQVLTTEYDYILLDSPPMIGLADPLILATMVDGVILVVNASNYNQEHLNRNKHELHSVGANILGIVLNNAEPSKENNPYSHYSRNHMQSNRNAPGTVA